MFRGEYFVLVPYRTQINLFFWLYFRNQHFITFIELRVIFKQHEMIHVSSTLYIVYSSLGTDCTSDDNTQCSFKCCRISRLSFQTWIMMLSSSSWRSFRTCNFNTSGMRCLWIYYLKTKGSSGCILKFG